MGVARIILRGGIGFALLIVSLPWVMWAAFCAMAGDDRLCDRVLARAPLSRWFVYLERHP